jgi:hypothetical protein
VDSADRAEPDAGATAIACVPRDADLGAPARPQAEPDRPRFTLVTAGATRHTPNGETAVTNFHSPAYWRIDGQREGPRVTALGARTAEGAATLAKAHFGETAGTAQQNLLRAEANALGATGATLDEKQLVDGPWRPQRAAPAPAKAAQEAAPGRIESLRVSRHWSG